ncbi:MAG: AraC family transcriptional regulator [Prevotella sp.]|nr:AraC family transcriptional regulator [Prevotella sp.]
MSNPTKLDPSGYIDFGNLLVDYSEGDIMAYEKVKDFSKLFPPKAMINLIMLCSGGHARIKANERTIDATEGEILICPPSVKTWSVSSNDDFECRVISISDHIIQGLLHDKIHIWHHAVYVNQMNVINLSNACRDEFSYYYSLIRLKTRNQAKGEPTEILLALVRAFLLELCFHLEGIDNDEEQPKLSQGKVLFNRFLSLLSSSDIKRQPVSFYASQLAITPKYLTMLCVKYSDKTASDWIIQYTTEEIRFYLKSSNLTIKEISAKLGFSNMSHFGSYVRKHLGVSPSDFRHHH